MGDSRVRRFGLWRSSMSNVDTLDKATSKLATAIKLLRLLIQGGATDEQLQGPIGNRTKRINLLEYIALGCPKFPTSDPKKPEPAAPTENERFRVIDENTIEVNLGAPPKLPFDGAIIDTNSYPYLTSSRSWVKIEKYGKALYQDGVMVVLHLEDGQKNGKSMQGHKLRSAIANQTSVHPNVFDALIECNMMPEFFKVDGKGQIQHIFSFAVVYRDRDGLLYVRFWYCYDGRWQSYYSWLDNRWGGSDPSALLAI
jgi:hypothetical protein